jgi:hypothetical protein
MPYVSFRCVYRFAKDDPRVHTPESTLRFRNQKEIERSLVATGFTTLDWMSGTRRTVPDGSTSSSLKAPTDGHEACRCTEAERSRRPNSRTRGKHSLRVEHWTSR